MLWLGEKRFQKEDAVQLADKLLSEINDAVDNITIPFTRWYPVTLEGTSWATTAETIEAQPYTQYITNNSTGGTYEATGV